jgi:hypothetical protein
MNLVARLSDCVVLRVCWRSGGQKERVASLSRSSTREHVIQGRSSNLAPFKPPPLKVDTVNFTLRTCSMNREADLVDMRLDWHLLFTVGWCHRVTISYNRLLPSALHKWHSQFKGCPNVLTQTFPGLVLCILCGNVHGSGHTVCRSS